MKEQPIFQLAGAVKRYGSFEFRIDTLDVRAGEVLGLIGPTGAGKSTLLRIMGGLESIDSGKTVFDGSEFRGERLELSKRRRITMLDQRPILLQGSVRYNVGYGLRLRSCKGIDQKVSKVLNRLELSAIESQSARTLSGGQAQLVALARALLIEPEVLLLDEPTAHLDPAHVGLVEAVVNETKEASNMTVVWATHNLFQARRVASRTALLLDGSLIELGNTAEVFERPTDRRTIEFIEGRMIY